jgi:uncharacterized protein (TIGR01777 family)
MHVAIAGGSGLIGRALAVELVNHGHTVTVLSRDPAAVSPLPPGMRAEAWDARSVEAAVRQVELAGAIVHLAGEDIAGGRWTRSRKRRILESRLVAGSALAKAVMSSPRRAAVFVQASAVGYYGPRGDEEVTEESAPGNDYLAHLVVQWEGATAGVEAVGVRRAIVRTGLVLAQHGGALERMLPFYRLGLGGPLAGGRQYLPWIHLVDVAGAIRFLIENDEARGPFNLTAPHPVTNAQFNAALGRVLHRPAKLPIPGFALRLAFGEMSTVLIDGQRAVPARLMRLGYAFRFTDLETALRDVLA